MCKKRELRTYWTVFCSNAHVYEWRWMESQHTAINHPTDSGVLKRIFVLFLNEVASHHFHPWGGSKSILTIFIILEFMSLDSEDRFQSLGGICWSLKGSIGGSLGFLNIIMLTAVPPPPTNGNLNFSKRAPFLQNRSHWFDTKHFKGHLYKVVELHGHTFSRLYPPPFPYCRVRL